MSPLHHVKASDDTELDYPQHNVEASGKLQLLLITSCYYPCSV